MAFTPFGSAGGGAVAGDYVYKQNADGQLELWKGAERVSIQSPDGSWFTDNISTGVGSLHLGGNDSGGVAHSVSSCGQNVGFKNEFSRLAADDKLFFFPPWQGVTANGSSLVSPSVLSFGAIDANSLPNGAPHASVTALYNFAISPVINFAVFKVSVIAGEVYSGRLSNVIVSNTTNAEIYNTSQDVSVSVGQSIVIEYKYPFFVRNGDNLQLRLIKADGNYLRCRSGVANTAIPYRQLTVRSFQDSAVINSIQHLGTDGASTSGLYVGTGDKLQVGVDDATNLTWDSGTRNSVHRADFHRMYTENVRMESGRNGWHVVMDENYRVIISDVACYLFSPDGTERVDVSNDKAVMRSGGTDRVVSKSTEAYMISPNGNNRIHVADNNVYMSYGGNNFIAIDTDSVDVGGKPGVGQFHLDTTNAWIQAYSGRYIMEYTSGNAMFIRGGLENGGGGWISISQTTFTGKYSYSPTSDKRKKTAMQDVPTALLDVWQEHVKIGFYKMLDEGATGRNHVGVYAQDIQAAFTAAGLDWQEWGIINKNPEEDIYHVSYNDVLAIECALMRRRIDQLQSKLSF